MSQFKITRPHPGGTQPPATRAWETLGIFPKNSTNLPHLAGECPYPLASLYATHLVGPVSLHQAFQVHASLQDVTLAIIQLLTSLIRRYYRKENFANLKQDKDIEELFQKLKQPSLEIMGYIASFYPEPIHGYPGAYHPANPGILL